MYCSEYTNLKEKVVIDEFVPKLSLLLRSCHLVIPSARLS